MQLVYYIQAVIETMVGIFVSGLNNRLDKVALLLENEPGNSGSRSSGGCCTDSNAYDQSVYDHSNLLLPLFLLWAVSGLKR